MARVKVTLRYVKVCQGHDIVLESCVWPVGQVAQRSCALLQSRPEIARCNAKLLGSTTWAVHASSHEFSLHPDQYQ